MPSKQQKRKKKEARGRAQGPVNNYVGRKLREIRLARGITCQQVARRLGISAGTYSGLENSWCNISLDNLFRILKALEAEVDEVWPPKPPPARRIEKESLDQLAALATNRPAGLGIQDVLEAVSEAFEVSPEQLASNSSWSRLQEARGVCAILVREISGLQFRSLVRRLKRSETTLGRLERRHRSQAKEDGPLAARIESIRRALKQRDGDGGNSLV